jgi:hypothetical protein
MCVTVQGELGVRNPVRLVIAEKSAVKTYVCYSAGRIGSA